MQVERLKLNYFRNYEALDLRPNPGLNVIVGENAHICAGAVVGEETGLIAVVGPKAEIASGDKVAAGVQIDADAQ